MNRRELFKRLAGVGVVGFLGVWAAPKVSPADRLIGRVVEVTGYGLRLPKAEREELAKTALMWDYNRRVKASGLQYTPPRWTHVPQDPSEPYMFDRELWGYYAEAIERV